MKGGDYLRKNLKLFRVEKELSQEQLAAEIGCDRAYYGHIERGIRDGSNLFWSSLQNRFNLSNEKLERLQHNEKK